MTPTPIPMQPENQHQSIRLFENDFLERLSHVHPITPLLMWGPIAGWLIWRRMRGSMVLYAQAKKWATSAGAGMTAFSWCQASAPQAARKATRSAP